VQADVWMLPAMLPQHPGIARAMIEYRFRTMGAAVTNAQAEHRNGTKWAWESAFSGVSATGGDCQEIHLQAGIAMALRSYFRQTHDLAWLRIVAMPMLTNIVEFFESRVSPASSDETCAAGRDCLSLNGVQSPNEYASGISNDIYTNTAFFSVLQWLSVAAELINAPNASRFAALAKRIVIPFNSTLDRHSECATP
jgi:trehalose/maltose hydrolase-like predicted phosphorylase